LTGQGDGGQVARLLAGWLAVAGRSRSPWPARCAGWSGAARSGEWLEDAGIRTLAVLPDLVGPSALAGLVLLIIACGIASSRPRPGADQGRLAGRAARACACLAAAAAGDMLTGS